MLGRHCRPGFCVPDPVDALRLAVVVSRALGWEARHRPSVELGHEVEIGRTPSFRLDALDSFDIRNGPSVTIAPSARLSRAELGRSTRGRGRRQRGSQPEALR